MCQGMSEGGPQQAGAQQFKATMTDRGGEREREQE